MCCNMLGIFFIPSPTVSTEHVRAGPTGLRGEAGAVEGALGRRKLDTRVEADDRFFKKGDGRESGSE